MNLRSICACSVAVISLAACNGGSVLPASSSGTMPATREVPSTVSSSSSPASTPPSASPSSSASPSASPTASGMNTSGTQTINGQLIQGIPLADGSMVSISLPTLANAPTVQYSGYTNASRLPSGLILPATGTFVGGITASSPSAFTIPSATALSINLIQTAGMLNLTYTAYYLSSTAPVQLYSQQQGAGSFVFPASVVVNANQSYTLAVYSSNS